MPEPYIDLEVIRGLGITEEQADDDAVNAAILLSQQLLERATRNWFGPQAAEFSFDGNDSDTAYFEIPIISLAWLRLNDSPANLETVSYRVYSGRGGADGVDDRKNPKISLRRGEARDIYTASFGGMKFLKGRQNQRVSGVFGYVESDDSTPAPIIEAMKRMVIERLGNPPYGTSSIAPPMSFGGVVIEEETDGHRIRYSDAAGRSNTRQGLTGITKDAFVLDVIRLYKAPIAMASPAHWSTAVR